MLHSLKISDVSNKEKRGNPQINILSFMYNWWTWTEGTNETQIRNSNKQIAYLHGNFALHRATFYVSYMQEKMKYQYIFE